MNALTDRFLTCYTKHGVRKLSTLEAMRECGEIICLADDPVDNFSSLRFMLSLLGWASKGAEFDPEIACERLAGREKSFELFGAARFYQITKSQIREDSEYKTISSLMQDIPSGNTVNYTCGIVKAYDDEVGLCHACCLKGLLRLPVFCTQERGKSASVNNTPPQYFYPVGDSLCETLRLNYRKAAKGDEPAWARQTPSGAVGYLEAFTWQPRAIYLRAEEDDVGRCYYCGDESPVVRQCVFEDYFKYMNIDRPTERIVEWSDPHVLVNEAGKNVIPPNPVANYEGYRNYRLKVENLLAAADQTKVECVGRSSNRLKGYYEYSQTVVIDPATRTARTVAVNFADERHPWADEVREVSPGAFVGRLRRLDGGELAALRKGAGRLSDPEAYRAFCKIHRSSGLRGKRVTMLTAEAYANHPRSGPHVIRLDDGPIGLPAFRADLLKRVAACRASERGINWPRLVEDLYQLERRS